MAANHSTDASSVITRLTPVPPATSDLRVLAAWHAEQSALLRDELAAEAREAGDETEADTCEAYAAGVRAESQRKSAAGVGHRRPLASAVCSTPATVELCRMDYAANPDTRARFNKRATQRSS